MSKPSFENIDRWFFEYSEGNLSPAQVQEFETFLNQNPGLRSELDLWEDARVEAPNTEGFAVSSLRRPVVPYGAILTYTVIGVLIFLSGFLVSTYFQEMPKYSSEYPDTSIIQVEEEPLFEGKVFKENTSTVRGKQLPTNNEKPIGEQTSTEVKSFSGNVASNHGSTISNANSTSKEIKRTEKSSTDIVFLTHDESDQLASGSPNRTVQSNDLPEIIDYINGEGKGASKTVAENKSQIKKVEVSNSLKRKFRSVLRKIKRMADQPIALRNTKDQYFHVPMMTGFNANFGMVGSARGNRFQMTSRNQWVGHKNQQLQNTASWDGYVYALRGGLGVDVSYNDYQKNAIQNYTAALTYSPKFSLNKNISIEPALRFKMGVVDLNNESSIVGSNIEMIRSNITPLFVDGGSPIGSQLWYRDIGAGIMLNTKWFYAGLNVDNLGRHYNNFYSVDIEADHRQSSHLTGVIGTEYESMTKDMKISGYALFQNYGELSELWGGVNAQYKWIQGGVATSSNFGLAASFGVVLDNVSIHYNLDKTHSVLKDEKLLSHQLTMRILMRPSRYAAKFLNL